MVTIFAWFGYDLPKTEYFKTIKQAGFDGVSLWWADDLGDGDYRSNPELVRKLGLHVENIHAPFDKVNNLWLDNLDGSGFMDYLLGLVDDCSQYDIPAMVLHLTDGNPPPYSEIGLDRIKRLIDKAENRNINVAFENLSRIEYLEYILSNVDSPRAGFCYDSGHHICHTPDTDLISRYGSRLMALHLHDNDGMQDQHKLPFDGTINWADTMGRIGLTGYKGAAALEVNSINYSTLPPEQFMRMACERAKKLETMMKQKDITLILPEY